MDIESKKKNANIRLKSVFQHLFNILEAQTLQTVVFLNSRHFKVGIINLAVLLLGVLIADKKKKKLRLLHCLLRYCILSYCCNSVFGVVLGYMLVLVSVKCTTLALKNCK